MSSVDDSGTGRVRKQRGKEGRKLGEMRISVVGVGKGNRMEKKERYFKNSYLLRKPSQENNHTKIKPEPQTHEHTF